MSNAVITQVGPAFEIAGATRVHVYVTFDLSGGSSPGGEGEFSVSFPFAGAAPVVSLEHGAQNVQLTAPPTPIPGPTFPGKLVVYAMTTAGSTRTVTLSIADIGATPPVADAWILTLVGLPVSATPTIATPSINVTALRVEADPIIECDPLPASSTGGVTIPLSGRARRNMMPVPTAADYSPPTPVLTWTQDPSDIPAAPPGATAVVAGAVAGAAGFSATASVPLPPAGATLNFILTATFGPFTATCPVNTVVSSVAHYWSLILDRSRTMGDAPGTKWIHGQAVLQLWADIISGFRYSPTTQDRIGVTVFNDPSSAGFRAAAPSIATIDVAWPAPSTFGALLPISAAAQDGFKVGGTSVFGTPGNQTPLGDAVIRALDVMAATPSGGATISYDLLVVTDALENTGSVKVGTGASVLGASLAQTFDSVKNLGARSIFSFTGATSNTRLYVVGTGTPINTTALNTLATYGASPFIIGTGLADVLNTAFGTALFASLGAVQQAVSPTPPVNPDATPLGVNEKAYFAVPANEAKVVVAVVWPTTAPRNLVVEWRPQSGGTFSSVPAPAITVANRAGHGIAVIDMALLTSPNPAPATEWRVRVTSGGVNVNFAVTDVLAGRDLHVRTSVTFDRDMYFNDEPMTIRASVHAGGRPIPDARIAVEVTGPAVSEGELVAANERAARPPASGSKAVSLVPAGSREAILERVLASRKLQSLPTVTYSAAFADGTSQLRPDPFSAAGWYENVFAKNWREGTYTFRFTISGLSPNGGAFSDVITETRVVRIRADDAFSSVSVGKGLDQRTPGLETAVITVTPKDALGQRLGPFHADAVDFTTTRGAFLDEIEAELDGSYSKILLYPRGQVPVVTPVVHGRAFAPVVVASGFGAWVTSLVRGLHAWLIRTTMHR